MAKDLGPLLDPGAVLPHHALISAINFEHVNDELFIELTFSWRYTCHYADLDLIKFEFINLDIINNQSAKNEQRNPIKKCQEFGVQIRPELHTINEVNRKLESIWDHGLIVSENGYTYRYNKSKRQLVILSSRR